MFLRRHNFELAKADDKIIVEQDEKDYHHHLIKMVQSFRRVSLPLSNSDENGVGVIDRSAEK